MYSSPAEEKAYQDLIEKTKAKLYELLTSNPEDFADEIEFAYQHEFEGGFKMVSRGNETDGQVGEYVWYFHGPAIYLKISGYYSSYGPIEWNNDLTQVFLKEKTITVFEVAS